MQSRWVNATILDELIYKCDLAYRQLNVFNAPINEIIFKLNLQIAARLRLIKPVRDIGNAGPLKVNLEDGEYFYALEDVNKHAVASRSHLAIKYLLPARTQAIHQINLFGELAVFFHSPNYDTLIKEFNKGSFSVQFAQGCLQYTKKVLFEQTVQRNVKN